MSTERARDYFNRVGIKFKGTGRELVIECPECGGSKCYVNDHNFKWHCKSGSCNAAGNEVSFKTRRGDMRAVIPAVEEAKPDPMTDAILRSVSMGEVEKAALLFKDGEEGEEARNYLLGRGISTATAANSWVGVKPRDSTKPRRRPGRAVSGSASKTERVYDLTLPSFSDHYQDGRPDPTTLKMIKVRNLRSKGKGDRYKRVAGGETALYMPRQLSNAGPVVIVGGEIDALSVVELKWNNVVSPTTGEGAWPNEFSEALEDFDDIVIILDNDEAGKKGAQVIAKALGRHRCRIGQWPMGFNDVNEALVAGAIDHAKLQKIITNAPSAEASKVMKIGGLKGRVMSYLTSSNQSNAISTGWTDIDILCAGGFRGYEVWVVTGETGSGKTTWTSNLALNVVKQGESVLYCPFELGLERQVVKFMRQLDTGPKPRDMTDIQKEDAINELAGYPLWLLEHFGTISPEAIRNTLKYANHRLGIKIAILDHLHFMINDGDDARVEIDKHLRAAADIVKDTGMTIVFVAHPANGQSNGDNRIVQMRDLKGSSSIRQVADMVLSLWRPRDKKRGAKPDKQGFFKAIMYFLKARDDDAQEGSAPLKFDPEQSVYHDDAGINITNLNMDDI